MCRVLPQRGVMTQRSRLSRANGSSQVSLCQLTVEKKPPCPTCFLALFPRRDSLAPCRCRRTRTTPCLLSRAPRRSRKAWRGSAPHRWNSRYRHSCQQTQLCVCVCVFLLGCVCVLQTAEVVQFILVKDQKKIPIRRAGRAARRLVPEWAGADGASFGFRPHQTRAEGL